MSEVFCSAAVAAMQLGITKRAIQKKAKNGRIPGAKLAIDEHGRPYWQIPRVWVAEEKMKRKK